MSSPHHGKTRFVVSDTDMLCALEIHVPGVRAVHSSLSKIVRIVAGWDEKEMAVLDRKLQRRYRAEQRQIQDSFVRSALSRIRANHLDQCKFNTHIDLYTLLEMGWGMHMLQRSIEDTCNGYELVYRALTNRIAERNHTSAELDDLHKCYGQLTQARLKLRRKLKEMDSSFAILSQGFNGVQDAKAAVIEAYAACTDIKDFLLLLKTAHQRGFDYARNN